MSEVDLPSGRTIKKKGGFTLILVGVGGQTIGELVEQSKTMLINLRVSWCVHFCFQLPVLLKKMHQKTSQKVQQLKRDTFSSPLWGNQGHCWANTVHFSSMHLFIVSRYADHPLHNLPFSLPILLQQIFQQKL